MRYRIFLWTFCLLLTSCGFHWRGQLPLASPLKSLSLKTDDPYGEIAQHLKQFLSVSNVHLTDDPTKAKTVLVILNTVQSEQLLSVSGTQQTRQYKLFLTLTFQVTNTAGDVIVPPQTVIESRILTVEANQILGGSSEEELLYQQMREAIVYDIMTRLASDEITQLLLNPKTSL